MAFLRMTNRLLPPVASRLLVGATVLLGTQTSWATANYPSYLIQNYGWAGSPTECTLCHTDNLGGATTVTRAFGRALQQKGLTGGGNVASLDAAIAALGTLDSDGDEVSDFDELTQQGDPNDPNVRPGGFVTSEPVEYGCVGGTIARSSESSPSAALVAAGFVAAALLWSRRRRREQE